MNDVPLGLSRSASQAGKHALRSQALVLIGVAAAFYAAFVPKTTKPWTASKLVEVDHAVACPPQWLPMLLASSTHEAPSTRRRAAACTPHYTIGDVNSFSATASMAPGIVTLNGVQIGHPVETGPDGTTSCDQIASIGMDDGVVRGVSSHVNIGFSVPIIGDAGELIEFRYWNAAEGKEYFSEFRYTMQDNGQLGSYGAKWTIRAGAPGDPVHPASACLLRLLELHRLHALLSRWFWVFRLPS